MFRTKSILIFCVLGFSGIVPAMSQYAPQAGNEGSTAIHKDSVLIHTFNNYSASFTDHQLNRGWVNKGDTTLGKASVGKVDSFISEAPGQHLLSLGDGGSLVLKLQVPIINKPGPDFVVFENGFPFGKDSFFLELAFVEVSTDGKRFFRFPAHSLTDTQNQVGPFGSVKAHLIHNLAGKYVMPYGVPFDLEDLKDSLQGVLSLQYLKFVDVVGSLNPMLGERDAKGNLINDPWPTPFPSSGFDLLMVGFIHLSLGSVDDLQYQEPTLFPNPVCRGQQVEMSNFKGVNQVFVSDMAGRVWFKQPIENSNNSHSFVVDLLPGMYVITMKDEWGRFITKKLWVQP